MAEKQSPKKLGELLKTQMHSENNSSQTLATKPKWASEIIAKYGDIREFCNRFSYARIDHIVQDPIEVFRKDTPTLVRMDVTYGKKSSVSWLFRILQSMFVMLGVTADKFSKEQIYMLAQTVSTHFKTLKVAEIMLFISQFTAGKYGRFYGSDSYVLVFTEAMNIFMEERAHYYDMIERRETVNRLKNSTRGAVPYKEYKKKQEEAGETTNLDELFG